MVKRSVDEIEENDAESAQDEETLKKQTKKERVKEKKAELSEESDETASNDKERKNRKQVELSESEDEAEIVKRAKKTSKFARPEDLANDIENLTVSKTKKERVSKSKETPKKEKHSKMEKKQKKSADHKSFDPEESDEAEKRASKSKESAKKKEKPESSESEEEDSKKHKRESRPLKRRKAKKQLYTAKPIQITPRVFRIKEKDGSINEDEEKKMLRFFDKNGYAVIGDLLSPRRVIKAIGLFWNWAEGLGTGINRDDPETWENKFWPENFTKGTISQYGIGQSEFMWFLRSFAEPAFKSFWFKGKQVDAQGLLTSMEGASVFRPNGKSNWKTKNNWYHVDQNGCLQTDFQTVQGFFNLLESDESTGGMVLIPGSCHQHSEFFQTYKNKAHSNTVSFDKDQVEFFENAPVFLELQPGEFVMWDSRTVVCTHSGHSSTRGSLVRLGGFVSMSPMEKVAVGERSDLIEARKNAVTNGWTLDHIAHEMNVAKPPSKFPRKGEPITNEPIVDALTPTQNRLLCGNMEK